MITYSTNSALESRFCKGPAEKGGKQSRMVPLTAT